MDTLVRQAAVKPAASPKPPAAKPKGADAPAQGAMAPRRVDVALFRNLPLAGTPLVSAADDKTLGSMDPIASALSKLETKGPVFAKVANGARLLTRVAGPTMWGVSMFFNAKLLFRALKDPSITPGSKVALAAGTVANGVGFVAAAVCALPLKVASIFGLSKAGLLTSNKISGLFGGIGGTIFNTINMIETLRKPDAKPAERFFAKAGFALGVAGFLFGTVALTASLPWMAPVLAKLPSLLPFATKAANVLGIAGMGVWIGQMVFGKNKWLGDKLKGTVLG
jgi:hypothetical protein